ncbi:MAG: hypothetical protein Q9221_007352 [Calogaya cf. arnoldii]
MSTKASVLPTSSRSGHPVYPVGNLHTAPTTAAANEPPNLHPSIEISPNGTWRAIAPRPGMPKIETLNLTSRFSYTAPKPPKAPRHRPKNALKKGLRPTKSLELPPASRSEDAMAATRDIYRQDSPYVDDEEEGVHSEPSPSKRGFLSSMSRPDTDIGEPEQSRWGSGSGHVPKPLQWQKAQGRPLGLWKERAVIQSHTGVEPMVHKRHVEEISSDEDDDDRTLYETTPPRATKVPRLMHASSQANVLAPYDGARTQNAHTNPSIGPSSPKEPPLHTFLPPTAAPATTPSANAMETPHNTRLLLPSNQKQTLPPVPSPPTNKTHNNTILRIYLPSPSPSSPLFAQSRTYIPLRLLSCPNNDTLFDHVSGICDIPVLQLDILRMHFDPEDVGGGDEEKEKRRGPKEVMGVKRGVEESFICFVQIVEEIVGMGRDGGNGVGVEVVRGAD